MYYSYAPSSVRGSGCRAYSASLRYSHRTMVFPPPGGCSCCRANEGLGAWAPGIPWIERAVGAAAAPVVVREQQAPPPPPPPAAAAGASSDLLPCLLLLVAPALAAAAAFARDRLAVCSSLARSRAPISARCSCAASSHPHAVQHRCADSPPHVVGVLLDLGTVVQLARV